ncbi:MAG TPA: carboxymuconolactone decarboxylase family protein [Actinophytocola sp.]|jgi:AhpD family alkylhydroperoxidase|uniref:carboxymuconolactone decarboxylase family protein n=1 Tax=Actinophytocola sp. TaxID=1872138 RepID=UPI002F95380D
MFADHTVESAPPAARRILSATERQLGYLPAAMARMAEAPQLMDGFLKLSGMFENTSLDPLAREVLIMTIARRNGCHLCMAMHTAKLVGLSAPPAVIAALRDGEPLDDPRLAELRRFTEDVADAAGDVGEARVATFLSHGFTRRQALEVVLGIGTYTLSTLANRLTEAPVDEPLREFAWEPQPAR